MPSESFGIEECLEKTKAKASKGHQIAEGTQASFLHCNGGSLITHHLQMFMIHS